MARFYFHTETETRMTDMEGTEYATFEEARHDAIRTCGALLKDAPASLWNSRPWSVTVTDHKGLILRTVWLDGQCSPAGAMVERGLAE